ncbi:hypothetical protein [Nocardia sp. NPDC005366]|uniref:hypothetical protein n=1 Tax=Nocardia sp. NPDC005366 TaxID=3156878 RepID=UPI0033A45012
MTGAKTAPAYPTVPVVVSDPGDPFGDGQPWHAVGQVRDEAGRVTRVLYECRYLIESDTAAAWVRERRWHDGVPESRDVEQVA